MNYVFPKDWRGQFVIGLAPALRAGAVAHGMPSLALQCFEGIEALPVMDGAGQQIGTCLGVVFDRDRRMLRDHVQLRAPLPGDLPALESFIEDEIYALAGAFVFVLDCPLARRVYLDACGSLSAVYSPARREVAATSLLLVEGDDPQAGFQAARHSRLGVLQEGWFVAGLTAHEGILRLMPNFYLDLETFQTHRHWPRGEIARTDDPQAACAVILDELRATIAGTLADDQANFALTAGNETRMLLAAVKDQAEARAVSFFTVDAPGVELDVARSNELAKRFGLDHRLIPRREAPSEDQWDWHARTGYTFGGDHVRYHPTTEPIFARRYFIGGLGGEIGRGFFWRPGDTDQTAMDADAIWARMGMPRDEASVQAVANWLPSVAGLPGLLQQDLAYLELRMGCWSFAMAYANHRPVHIHPLISRKAFAAMLSLPPEWRRLEDGSFEWIREVIRQGWPELLELPIGRYGDWRDPASLVRRAIQNPHLVTKKLRKMFG